MDAVLKKNIRRTLILMLVSAVLGFLPILSFCLVVNGPRDLPVYALFLYAVSCVLVWLYGITNVIWQLSIKRVWRIILGFAWLIIYPGLAYLWLVCCFLVMLLPHLGH